MTGFGSGADAVRQDVIGGGAQGAPAGAVVIAFPSLEAEVAGPGVPVQQSATDAIGIGGDLHVDLIVIGGVERLERVGNHVVVPQSPSGEHQIELVVEDTNDKPV